MRTLGGSAFASWGACGEEVKRGLCPWDRGHRIISGATSGRNEGAAQRWELEPHGGAGGHGAQPPFCARNRRCPGRSPQSGQRVEGGPGDGPTGRCRETRTLGPGGGEGGVSPTAAASAQVVCLLPPRSSACSVFTVRLCSYAFVASQASVG